MVTTWTAVGGSLQPGSLLITWYEYLYIIVEVCFLCLIIGSKRKDFGLPVGNRDMAHDYKLAPVTIGLSVSYQIYLKSLKMFFMTKFLLLLKTFSLNIKLVSGKVSVLKAVSWQ